MANNKNSNRLGVALVGLGSYSTDELAPALQQTSRCYLSAVVSNDPDKREEWRRQHGLKDENLYSYNNFDAIKYNTDIDIVYIVLPNDMHAEFTIRAAQAGKHVICEKPMATSVEECERMIEACEQAGVKLSLGYRLHFDPFHREMMRLGKTRELGTITKVLAYNGMDVGSSNQWRLDEDKAGGGPLMDVGIYCVQGAIYTIGQNPTAVTASFVKNTDPEKFDDVEEGMEWKMEFPDGIIAECKTSYKDEYNLLKAETDSGWFQLEPAYEYRGLKGETSVGAMEFEEVNQQALQIDDFARCIAESRESIVPGEMGLRDVKILMAIFEAARTGKRVELHLEPFETLIEM